MPAKPNRAMFIDATRGLAMLQVLIAHFAWIYFARHPEFTLGPLLSKAMSPAAPTFMVISGFLLGYIYETRQHRLGDFGLKLIDRGLFLLTIGHVIILLAYLAIADGVAGALRYGQVTDAIGLAIILGPILIVRWPIRARVGVAVALFIACWLAIAFWHPPATSGQWIKHTLFGTVTPGNQWSYNFPLLPWLCLYLAATAIGQHIATLRRAGREHQTARVLLTYAAAGFAISVAAKAAFWGVALFIAPSSDLFSVLIAFTDPLQKFPPGLGFFAATGGAALLLLTVVFFAEQRGWFTRGLKFASMIGQHSLFVFLVQEHVYVTWLWLLDPPYSRVLWPLLLVATIAVVLGITVLWDRVGGTHYFTVGFGKIWGPRRFFDATPQPVAQS
jgi:uncharacterized membrane protein